MKANDAFDNLGEAGQMIASDFEPLAEYFVRFIQAYQDAGIPIWAITPQNEPSAPTTYPGMGIGPWAEGQFITQNLEPALSAAGLDPRIFGGDDGTTTPSGSG